MADLTTVGEWPGRSDLLTNDVIKGHRRVDISLPRTARMRSNLEDFNRRLKIVCKDLRFTYLSETLKPTTWWVGLTNLVERLKTGVGGRGWGASSDY